MLNAMCVGVAQETYFLFNIQMPEFSPISMYLSKFIFSTSRFKHFASKTQRRSLYRFLIEFCHMLKKNKRNFDKWVWVRLSERVCLSVSVWVCLCERVCLDSIEWMKTISCIYCTYLNCSLICILKSRRLTGQHAASERWYR